MLRSGKRPSHIGDCGCSLGLSGLRCRCNPRRPPNYSEYPTPLNLGSQFKNASDTMSFRKTVPMETQDVAMGEETVGVCQVGRKIKIIGIPEQNPPFVHMNVKHPPRLWLCNYKKFNLSRVLYHPIEWLIGDVLGQPASGPAYNNHTAGPIGDSVTGAGMNYDSNQITIGNTTANTTVQVKGVNINQYSDFCYEVLPYTYPNSNTTASGKGLGFQDLFKYNPFYVYSGGFEDNTTMNMLNMGLNPGVIATNEVINAANAPNTDEEGGFATFCGLNHIFLKHAVECRIHNTSNMQTNFEVYFCQAKSETNVSPLAAFQGACSHETTTKAPSALTGIVTGRLGSACYDFGHTPTQFIEFNEQFDVFDKKVFSLGASATCSLHVKLPWQQVSQSKVNNIAYGQPYGRIGTYWIWVRAACKPQFDATENIFGSPRPTYCIQHYEKFLTMPMKTPVAGKLDLTTDNRTGVATSNFNEYIVNQTLTAGNAGNG